MNNKIVIFDEELYQKNLRENNFKQTHPTGGLSQEDIEKLKKDGLM